jgi:hypothetical protein
MFSPSQLSPEPAFTEQTPLRMVSPFSQAQGLDAGCPAAILGSHWPRHALCEPDSSVVQ